MFQAGNDLFQRKGKKDPSLLSSPLLVHLPLKSTAQITLLIYSLDNIVCTYGTLFLIMAFTDRPTLCYVLT